MSSCDGWAPQSAATSDACNAPAAAVCWLVGIYTLTKVPFYLFARPPSHGLEVCVLLGCAYPPKSNETPPALPPAPLYLSLSTPAGKAGLKTESLLLARKTG